MKPHLQEAAERWVKKWKIKVDRNVELLEEIPHAGLAKPHHWRDTWPGTTRTQGRNHPAAGAWLIQRYCSASKPAADPMGGDGGLWVLSKATEVAGSDRPWPFSRLYLNELELRRLALAKGNLVKRRGAPVILSLANAETWTPAEKVWAIITSPVFGKNHSNGKGAHQTQIRNSKNAHAMQEFIADNADNLYRQKGAAYWRMMLNIYAQMRTYVHRDGRAVIILKNYVKDEREVDDVGDHLVLARLAGWKVVGLHPRELAPSMFNQWKSKSDGRLFAPLEWSAVLKP